LVGSAVERKIIYVALFLMGGGITFPDRALEESKPS
jgi:hypothetical protein